MREGQDICVCVVAKTNTFGVAEAWVLASPAGYPALEGATSTHGWALRPRTSVSEQ